MKINMTGMRPTGRLHIGHLYGALSTIAALSQAGDAQCFVEIADLHALTTGFADVSAMRSNVIETVRDMIAAGVNLDTASIYRQSAIPEIGMIGVILGMVTPQGMLERQPTYKDMVSKNGVEAMSYGFLGYPLLQAADIVAVRGMAVPVGRDQEPHLEMAREVVRKFNHLYGRNTLVSPRSVETEHPATPGLDNRKMSKSYGNTIDLADDETTTVSKFKTAFTDPTKLRKDDVGHPAGCAVAGIHRIVSLATISLLETECSTGARGCVSCKAETAEATNAALRPLRMRRAEVGLPQIQEALIKGEAAARESAVAVLATMRQAMNLA